MPALVLQNNEYLRGARFVLLVWMTKEEQAWPALAVFAAKGVLELRCRESLT
jgi:hypothetical protein